MVKGRNTTYVGVRLPDELASRLKSEARKRKLSLSDYLRSVLATYWKRPGEVYERQLMSGRDKEFIEGDKDELPPDLELEPEHWTQAAKPKAKYIGTPRNALCPCGSGLKYKRCHGK